MEFRYRAIDTDRPPPATEMAPSQSLNPFFSAGPISAAEREIEKDQIRQEIIAAEAERRRELIAEGPQEKKGMSVGGKLTMWITQRKISNKNQDNILFRHKRAYSDPTMYTSSYSLVTSPEAKARPVLESKEEMLIILERPDPIAEDTQTSHERAKRKADCVEGGLNEPFKRKRPHSEPRALELKRSSLRSNTVETASSELPLEAVKSKPKSMYKFWCDVCSVGASSETVMRSHELGKKHKAAIKKQNQLPVTAPQSETITVLVNVQGDEMAPRKTTEGEKKKRKRVIIRCETCNILTYSEQVMETHTLGKKHKAMLKQQYSEQQVMEIHRLNKNPIADLDDNIITVPVESLNADPREEESLMVHCLEKTSI